MAKRILLRKIKPNGDFVPMRDNIGYWMTLDTKIYKIGLSGFALACIQSGKSSKKIIGMDDVDGSRVRHGSFMSLSKVCVLGVYIIMYGGHKINIGQLVQDFENENRQFIDAINTFNKCLQSYQNAKKTTKNHSDGKMLEAYFNIGINAVADFIKELFTIKKSGFFEKAVILDAYLDAIGINNLNICRLLNNTTATNYDQAHLLMAEHKSSLLFTIIGNNIYFSRPVESINMTSVNSTPTKEESYFSNSKINSSDIAPIDIYLEEEIDEFNKENVYNVPNSNKPTDIPISAKPTNKPVVENVDSTAKDDLGTISIASKEDRPAIDVNDVLLDATIESNPTIYNSREVGDVVTLLPIEIKQSNEHSGEIDTNVKSVAPPRPRTPITAVAPTEKLLNIEPTSKIDETQSESEAKKATIKNGLFKGVGKSPIDFNML